MSRNVYGEGLAYVIGAGVDAGVLLDVVGTIAMEQHVPVVATPDGVEWISRDDGAYEVLLNHTSQVQTVDGLDLKSFAVEHIVRHK